ncbi:MAG: NupC/NupG family nucleoside CNT transporter [Phycisphaerales bacterium JB059]
MGSGVGVLGVVVLLLIAWAISSDRGRLPWRIIVGGVAMQVVLALLLLKTPGVVDVFNAIASLINDAISAAESGTGFVWGHLADTGAQGERFVFAIHAMAIVIFFASLVSVLYHLGVMQRLIAALAWVLRRTLGVTGAEALAMAANVFVGQTEAPLCVKPYIERMTRSQLMTLMVGGFATIAGSVLAAYVGMLGGTDDAARELFIRHLLTASLMSAPAAFVVAKVIVPETEEPFDEVVCMSAIERPHVNALDAAAGGASEGMKLALNIVAMIIAFVSIVALINMPLGWFGRMLDADLSDGVGLQTLSIETILGQVFTPLAWSMGIEWKDCAPVGSLMGQKIVLTEFIAYMRLGEMINTGGEGALSPRSGQIAAYALCGFANFASIAIQIGGFSVIAPGRRADFVTLGLRAMIGGALASWMTASIAGLFIA